jgi:gliding motility-associated-like protein
MKFLKKYLHQSGFLGRCSFIALLLLFTAKASGQSPVILVQPQTQYACGQDSVVMSVTAAMPGTTLLLPWQEDFEGIGSIMSFSSATSSINGLPEWEYDKTNNGRLRFNAGTGFYHGGTHGGGHAATLDADPAGTSRNDMILTLDLSKYQSANDIELSFWFMDHADENSALDRVHIRGNNAASWIHAYSFNPHTKINGQWNHVQGIDIDQLLSTNAQSPGTTFQIKFVQYDDSSAILTDHYDGITIDDILIKGSFPFTYQWMKNGVDIPGATDSIYIINPATASDSGDVYRCRIRNVSDSITSNPASLHVSVIHPTANFTINNASQCFQNNSFVFTNQSAVNGLGLNYYWDFGDGNNATTVSPVYSYNTTAGVLDVKLIAETNRGCRDSVTKSISIFPSPYASFNVNDSSQCFTGNNFVFTNTTSIVNYFGTDTFNVSWNFGDATSSLLYEPTHSYSSVDSYQVTMIAVSDKGCRDTARTYMYVNYEPNAGFNINDNSQCYNGNYFLFNSTSSITGSDTLTNAWYFGDGNSTINTGDTSYTYTYADTFTVKLVTTSEKGCADSISKTLYVHPSPVTQFTINDTTQCLDGNSYVFTNTTNTSATSMNFLWNFGDGNTSLAPLTDTHSYINSNNYVVTLIATTDQFCRDTLKKNVYVHPMPSVDFDINDSTQCKSGNLFVFSKNINISSGTYNHIWYFGDLTQSNLDTPSHVYANYNTYLVELKATSNLGCVSRKKKNVHVWPSPEVDFSINNNKQCQRYNHFVFNNLTDSSGCDSVFYTWDFGDFMVSGNVSDSHAYSTSDTFDVKLIGISCRGCTDTMEKKAYVFPNPIGNIGINDTSQCLGSNSFMFTDNSSISTGSYTRKWFFGDASSDTASNPVKNYVYADTFLVQMRLTSDLNCYDTQYQWVYVNPEPNLNFLINNNIQCYNENYFEFYNNSSLQYGTQTYTYDFGDFINSTVDSPSHIYSYPDTFLVSLTAVTNMGCSDTLTKTVYVLPSPTSNFSINDQTQCFNENAFQFTNTSTFPGGGLNYVWRMGDATNLLQEHVNHTYLSDDTFQVRLISISPDGCPDTLIKSVYVHPSPQMSFSINDTGQCFRSHSFIFTNNSLINSGTFTRQWYFGDGNTSLISDPSHSYSNTGNYTVRLIGTSNLGCKDTSLRQISVFPMPSAAYTINNDKQCLNENKFNFTNNSSISTGTFDNRWFFGDGKTSLLENPSHTFAADGNFNIRLLLISDKGCRDSITKSVSVYPSPATMFYTGDSIQCFNGHEFFFTNASAISAGALTYQWNFGDGKTDITSNPSHKYTSDGTYQVRLISTSVNTCRDTLFKTVSVFPSPVAIYSVNNNSQCLEGNSFIFTNNSNISSGNISYLWEYGDGNTSSQANPTYSYIVSGFYTVKLTATSNRGCKDSSFIAVSVNPMPTAAFNHSVVCINDPVIFTDNSTIGLPDNIVSWNWDFDDGGTSILPNPTHIYNSSGTYTVRFVVSSNNGCHDEATQSFKVNDDLDANEIARATVVGEYVLVQWHPIDQGTPMSYTMERSINGGPFSFYRTFDSTVTQFTDKSVKVHHEYYQYRMQLLDSCKHYSPYSNLGSSILLKIDNTSDHPLLTWTPYRQWPMGIDSYLVQYYNEEEDTYSVRRVFADTATRFLDTEILPNQTEMCYRIAAFARGSNNYSVSNEICIPLDFKIWIPNAFTPNDDGNNDVFKIKARNIREYSISIFDTWGRNVFSSTDIDNSWDGNYEGKPCPEGVYIFVLKARGTKTQSERHDGSLLLIR